MQQPPITDPRPVAVIDDDIRFIRLIERILGLEGIRIEPITTLDLDEAVRVVGESRCQAALIDVYMYGDALGFTLIERLRASATTAKLPLLVTSGARREIGRKVDFLQQHDCGVLLKPFDPPELLAKLHEAMQVAAPIVEDAPAISPIPALGSQLMSPLQGGQA